MGVREPLMKYVHTYNGSEIENVRSFQSLGVILTYNDTQGYKEYDQGNTCAVRQYCYRVPYRNIRRTYMLTDSRNKGLKILNMVTLL